MVIPLGWSSNYMCWVVPWLGSLDYYLEVVGDLHHLRKMQNSFLDDDIRYISPKNPIKQKGETAKIKLLKDGAWISRVYNYPGCPFEIFHKPWKKGAPEPETKQYFNGMSVKGFEHCSSDWFHSRITNPPKKGYTILRRRQIEEVHHGTRDSCRSLDSGSGDCCSVHLLTGVWEFRHLGQVNERWNQSPTEVMLYWHQFTLHH